jgi:hypothetical protein
MKNSTKLLSALLGIGLLYSFYKLFTGHGGAGLPDFIEGLGYTSIALFIFSLAVIVFNVKHLKTQSGAFIFLLLALPMTMMAAKGIVQNISYNRNPDLRPKYPRPFTSTSFLEDSTRLAIQIDSLVALKNRNSSGLKILDAVIDTIIYSQAGDKLFISIIEKYATNDFCPSFVTADERDSIYWHLREGSPNNVILGGSYHDIASLKKEIRKFYFNQYTFPARDSLKSNFFWKINSN